jgi:hypothetical protein
VGPLTANGPKPPRSHAYHLETKAGGDPVNLRRTRNDTLSDDISPSLLEPLVHRCGRSYTYREARDAWVTETSVRAMRLGVIKEL